MTRTHRRVAHGIVAPIPASALLRAALLQAARHGGGQAVRDAAAGYDGARGGKQPELPLGEGAQR